MPADNLEVFKKVIFRLPELKTTLAVSVLSGFFFSAVLFAMLNNSIFNLNGFVFIHLLGYFLWNFILFFFFVILESGDIFFHW